VSAAPATDAGAGRAGVETPPIVSVETLRPAEHPNLLLVRLVAEDGSWGLGDAFFGAGAVEAYVHDTAAPLLLAAADPVPERAALLLRGHVGAWGSGVETRGNGAIDVALWDLLARRAGLPLANLLGGPVRREIDVYNTCAGSRYVRDATGQAVSNWGLAGQASYEDLDAFLNRPRELARELRAEGLRAMKVWPFDIAAEATHGMRLDRAAVRKGLGILDAIRSEVGAEMDLLVELHGLWNLPSAVRLLRELERFEPFWVEDPLRADDALAYGHLRERVAVPIATGEALTGRRQFRALLEQGALDVAIVDLGWTGGLTEARKVAALADAYSVPVAPHDCTGPISFAACVHFVAAQPNGLIQESVRAFHRTWYREIADGIPEIAGGVVRVPDAPGLGVQVSERLEHSPQTIRRISRAG
jgi:L-alanine-DL-glutamate epimerase-like enolase superfamily enzyme